MSDEDRNDISIFEAVIERANDAMEGIYASVADLEPARLTIETWQDTSARIGSLLYDFDQAAGQMNSLLGLGGGQDRILIYLRRRVGEEVTKEELRGVAAIYEWARRVRELRVEHGWPIVTKTQRPELKSGVYVLEANEPDEQLAADWRLAKKMRNLKNKKGHLLSAKFRGLEFLKSLTPRAADKDQLQYVMNISSYARRLRELDEEGWQIVSNIDDPSLGAGTYRLDTLTKRTARARQAIKLRHQILERDSFQCRDDGRSPERDRVTLQVHHLKFVSQGGGNDADNLITLCADCHAGRHALANGLAKDELLHPSWALTTKSLV